jgi:hypothetical protein
MGRPEADWPIPAYLLEMRERVVITFRASARLLAATVPPPLRPALVEGRGVVSLVLAQARCLKAVGGAGALAREFRLAEVWTPVRWRPACRPPMAGNLLVRVATDRGAVARLARLALDRSVEALPPDVAANRDCEAAAAAAPWPAGSVFCSAASAETHLLHPDVAFVPDRRGRVVLAVPVHCYARSTTPRAALAAPFWLAAALGARPDDLAPDHVLVQKRCTHTWYFPPETILTVPALVLPSRLPRALPLDRAA